MSKPITDVLRLLQGGAFNSECGDRMADIVKGVDETGKAGRLTITIDVKKAGAAVSVLAKVTDKTPEEQADADLYWPTVEGNLSLQNPAQRSLNLEPVPMQSRQIESIDPSTGEIHNVG